MDMLRRRAGKREVVISSMNAPLPYAVEDSFGGCVFQDDDDDLAQVLQDQEILYHLFQRNDGTGSSRMCSVSSSTYGHDRISNERKPSGDSNYELQLVVDEALARELQVMEGQLVNTSLNDDNGNPTTSSSSNSGSSSTSRIPQVIVDDDIDPDGMTYEELQELGEAMGTKSKGLPERAIALLPTSTYKNGIFSRKQKHDECVICCMSYKNRDKLTKLPCKHQYHQACVAKWLQINKVCPVCNKEVFGS